MPQPTSRRLALAVSSVGVAIVSLDTTVLNVSIPTILRDFGTSLPSLQWVITGYALTFASLLIIGGRLGDIYGHRRIFIIGASLFGFGSLIAAVSQNVLQLIVGEAVIEGIGASLMLPSTLAIISTTFEGEDRVKAFGVWGAVSGASAAVGPVVGGLLTSNASWRWSFGINVVVVPLAIVGAMAFMERPDEPAKRQPLDVAGAIMIALGMFLLIFGLSEGPRQGWLRPLRSFRVGRVTVWPQSMPVSVVVGAITLSAVTLVRFVVVELTKERCRAAPLFEFSQLRRPAVRYGLGTMLAVSIGQLGLSFVLPIFLQEGRQLSAQANGLWQLPTGIAVVVGSQLGSRLAIRFGPVMVVRGGLVAGAVAFAYVAAILTHDLSFLALLPGLVLYGVGLACALTQLTNIVLSDVDRSKSGAASGANNTAKQVGQSIGVAIISALLTSRLAMTAPGAIRASTSLSADVKSRALQSIGTSGVDFRVPTGASESDAATLHRLFADSLASSARYPLMFSCAVMVVGLLVSTRLPRRMGRDTVPLESALESEIGMRAS